MDELKLIFLGALQADFEPDANAKTTGLLVKKWTGVIRLQRKVHTRKVPKALFADRTLDYGP
jgi:hypothetical protein